MKKVIRSALLLLALLVCLSACGGQTGAASTETAPAPPESPAVQDVIGDGNYTQTELEALLADESVTQITIEGMIGLNRPLTVTGSKTIQGDGMLIYVGDELKAGVGTKLPTFASDAQESLTMWRLDEPELTGSHYALEVKNGGSLTLSGSVNLCGNYASEGVLVEEGGSLILTEEATISRAVNANLVNYGAVTLSGGSLAETNGYQIVNYGDLAIEDGAVTGSGAGCGAIYSAGTVKMTGGVVQQAKIHGFYLAAGTMELSGGEITACEKDGVFVAEAASLNVTSSAAKVNQHSRYGVMSLGKTVIDGGRFTLNGEANLKNGLSGEMVINGGNVTDSKWAGVYNMGQMEIHGGNFATNSYSGIINTGELTMDGGALYANSGAAQFVNRTGKALLSGKDVSVTSSKSAGLLNDVAGYMEVTNITLMDQQNVHIRNWGDLYVHDQLLDNNSSSSAIYNDCGGHLKAERVTIQNSYVHGLYNVGEATAELSDITMTGITSRGIQNKGGYVTGRNITVDGSKGVAVGNDYDKDGDSGDITITGLKVPYSYSGAIINQCDGTVRITNCQVGATEKTAVKIEGGRTYLDGLTIEKTVSPGEAVVHGIYLQGGYLNIRNSRVSNPTGCTLQNKAGVVEGSNVIFENSTNAAVNNAFSDDGTAYGSITFDHLTVRGSNRSNVANPCSGTITLRNSTLEVSKLTNVSASNGTMVLENTKILGCAAEASPCLYVYGGATVTMSGKDSVITGGVWRAVSVGSSTNEGTFIFHDGVISGNGTPELSTYGGGVNVGQKGVFIMDGGTISGNTGNTGAQLYLAANATAKLTGGTITGVKETYGDTVRLGSTNSHLGLGGTVKLDGVIKYNHATAYVELLSGLNNRFVIAPYRYNSQQQVLKAEDGKLVADNCDKFALEDPEAIYYIGSDGFLHVKDGVDMVARNQTTGTEYPTLQEAILSAPTDGTETGVELLTDLELTEGLIIGEGRNVVVTTDGENRTITRGFDGSVANDVTFDVVDGGKLTLRGGENGTTLTVLGSQTAKGRTIRVGAGKNDGSGLVLQDGAILTGNQIDANVGGGVVYAYGTFRMEGGEITGNSTGGNGTIFLGGGSASFVMTGGTISGNTTTKSGGGIYVGEGGNTAVITGGVIEGNHANSTGGGALIYKGATLTLDGDGEIRGNTTGSAGAGIQIGEGGTLELKGGRITGNIANGGKANGGGIQMANSAILHMTGGEISENTANNGGGININNSEAVISGGTVRNNTAGGTGDDVNVANAGAKVSVEGGAALGNVGLAAGAKLTVTGALTAELTGVLTPANPANGQQVLQSSDEAFWTGKFRLDQNLIAAGYTLTGDADGNGVLRLDGAEKSVELSVSGGSWTEYDTLEAALAAIPENGTGVVRVKQDLTVAAKITLDGGRTVTITSDGTSRVIRRVFPGEGANDVVFDVIDGAGLTLQGNGSGTLTLQGMDGAKGRLIRVGDGTNDGSTLTMKDGAILTGNKIDGSVAGSAVYAYGVFTMEGGKITGNKTGSNGTVMAGGKGETCFVLKGGEISGNEANNGGGVAVGTDSHFTMTGGTITGNTATNGGGVYGYKAEVTVSGGEIRDNTASGTGANVNIGVTGGAVSFTGGTIQDVTLVKNGSANVSGGAVLGDVTLGSGAKLVVTAQLTAERTGTITPAARTEGVLLLESSNADWWKDRFALDGETIALGGTIVAEDGNGKLHLETKIIPVELSLDGESYTGYETLDAALAAIPEGSAGTIRLKSNLSLDGTVTIGGSRTVTFTDDGEARTISRGSGNGDILFSVESGAVLTLKGTAADRLTVHGGLGDTKTKQLVKVLSGGTLNLQDGAVLTGNNANDHGSAVHTAGTVAMTGGKITGNTTDGSKYGGGIYVASGGAVTVSGGEISGNTSAGNGGGIQLASGGTVKIDGGSIADNSAVYGGGICMAGSAKELTISGGEIRGNTASNANSGDNIHISGGCRATMTGGTISGSAAKDIGVANADKTVLALGGSAQAGNVKLVGDKARIEVVSNLTAEVTATVIPKAYTEGAVVLTGDAALIAANHSHFKLADETYCIDSAGKIAKAAAGTALDGVVRENVVQGIVEQVMTAAQTVRQNMEMEA